MGEGRGGERSISPREQGAGAAAGWSEQMEAGAGSSSSSAPFVTARVREQQGSYEGRGGERSGGEVGCSVGNSHARTYHLTSVGPSLPVVSYLRRSGERHARHNRGEVGDGGGEAGVPIPRTMRD